MKSSQSTKSDERETGATHHVLGGGHVGSTIARSLRADGHTVSLVDESCDLSETPGYRGNPEDIDVLEEAGVEDASKVVVATRSDRRNLLIAQHVRVRFGTPEIFVVVNSPSRLTAFAEAGHIPVCATAALSGAVVDTL